MRVTVFASGSGTNLQALLDTCRPPEAAQISLVVTDQAGAGAGALDRAHRAGVPTHVLDDHRDAGAINAVLNDHDTDLVVLAGYLRLVPAQVVKSYEGRMLNVHPALLPSFGGKGMYGVHVHRAVLEAGVAVTGVTVHLVNEEYDKGKILAQWPVPVCSGDTADTLAARVLAVEHRLLPAVVLAAGRSGRAVALPCPPAFVGGTTPS